MTIVLQLCADECWAENLPNYHVSKEIKGLGQRKSYIGYGIYFNWNRPFCSIAMSPLSKNQLRVIPRISL